VPGVAAPALRTAAWLLCVAAVNVVLVLVLGREGAGRATLIAVLPAVLVIAAALVASNRSILVFGALGLEMTAEPITHFVFQAPGGLSVYPADILVLLAIGSWLVGRLVAGRGDGPRAPSTPMLGWPFALFSVAILTAVSRGHAAYGTSYFSTATKLVLYAGIAFAIADLEPRKVHRGLVVVFYVGTVWMTLNALYFLAVGRSQLGEGTYEISTGGQRVVSLTVAMYLATAIFLALLNLGIDVSARRRALHLTIAALAVFCILNAYGRTTFVAVVVALPFLFVFGGRVREAVVGFVPLLIPFVALAAILVPLAVPDLVPTLVERVTQPRSRDTSYQWRVEARDRVLEQFHESPIVGVGFGRKTEFQHDGFRYELAGQDAHNGYVYLLAGGGLFAFGTFLLLVATFLRDAVRRYRAAIDPRSRVIVVWSGLAVSVFLVNSYS
jgi:O-antigen ligase